MKRETPGRRIDPARLAALVRKESIQVMRDPSVALIAFVLPAMLLFLFAYAVSLDIRQVRIGVAMESDGAQAQSLAAAFAATRYFKVTPARDRRELEPMLVAGELRGFVVIPQDFEQRLRSTEAPPLIQVVTDGSQPNTANFVSGYAQGVLAGWRGSGGMTPPITVDPRFWFNPELESRRSLIPGAIAIVIAMIGTILTALVVAREWERGTMESIMATPASIAEILIGKLLPYLLLGLLATALCTALATLVYGVPLRGSLFALLALSLAFLIPALGQGLLISALTKNQFVASQVALFSGFLPAFLLSGFLFEIQNMPAPIRWLTYVIPARYFVAGLQTVFLAGDVWPLFLQEIGAMVLIGAFFFVVAMRRTRKSLDP
jgi:ABC-2 type transport system permease protein